MSNLIQNVVDSHEKNNLREFTNLLRQSQKPYLLHHDILMAFYKYCGINGSDGNFDGDSDLCKLIYFTQEIILDKESLYLVLCPEVTTQFAYRLLENMTVESINIGKLPPLQEKLLCSDYPENGELLKIDLQSFYNYFPHLLGDSKKLSHGVDDFSREISSKLFDDGCGSWQEALFDFLRLHKYNDRQLLINERIMNLGQLSEKLKRVIDLLEKYPPDTSYENFRFELRSFGFEPGWGNTACRARETLSMLDQLIDSAEHQFLSSFLSRIPMVFKILVNSPQECLRQEGVLATSDTAGQGIDILDGVKELEKQIQENAYEAGLDVFGAIEPKIVVLKGLIPNSEDTNCNQRLEKICGTKNCWILQLPEGKSQQLITQN